MTSEITRIREQLEQEAVTLMLLSKGYKTVSSHAIIEAAYDRLGGYQDQLERLVGKERATEMIVEALSDIQVLDIEPTPYLEETRRVLEQSGGRIEVAGTRIIAHLPKGTIMRYFEPRACFKLIFPDEAGMLLIERDGKNILLHDEYL